MSRAFTGFLAAIAVLGVASAVHADKERCKVKVGDEYRLIDRTYTRGGCEVEAKKFIAPRLCDAGDKKFEFKYMFDGTIFSGDGWCRNYASSSSSSASSSASSSSGRERCKVKDGEDFHFLPRTFTQGGCRVEAKKYIGPKLCESGAKKYHFTYLFDDTVFEDDGYCSNVQ